MGWEEKKTKTKIEEGLLIEERMELLKMWITIFGEFRCDISYCYSRKGVCRDKLYPENLRKCMRVRQLLEIEEYASDKRRS